MLLNIPYFYVNARITNFDTIMIVVSARQEERSLRIVICHSLVASIYNWRRSWTYRHKGRSSHYRLVQLL